MPKLKNCATVASSPATTHARGSSIIVPMRYATSQPCAAITSSATAFAASYVTRISSGVPTPGIITSGRTSTPRARSSHAASKIARTCIA